MKLVSIHKLLYIVLILGFVGSPGLAQTWTLEACIDTAVMHNKALQIGRNNISIGDERYKEARANLYPKISLQAEYKYFTNLPYQLMPLSTFNPSAPEGQFNEIQFGVPHNLGANVQLVMPLYTPQLYGAIQKVQISNDLNDLQYRKTLEQIYLEVAQLFYNAQILHHQLLFIQGNLENAEKLLKNVKLLNHQLLAQSTDVDRVQLQVNQLTTQRQIISNQYKQVIDALKTAIGLPISRTLEIDHTIEYGKPIEFENNYSVDISIIQAQNKMLASELSTVKKSSYLPTIHLLATYGTTGFGYNGAPSGFLNFYPIGFAGFQLSYPLFNGSANRHIIKRKSLEIENNELQLQLISEQTSLKIKNADLQRKTAIYTIETTAQQVELASSIYSRTVLEQEQGTASLTQVLLAENAMREAQQSHLSAIVDYLKYDLELKILSGNLAFEINNK